MHKIDWIILETRSANPLTKEACFSTIDPRYTYGQIKLNPVNDFNFNIFGAEYTGTSKFRTDF